MHEMSNKSSATTLNVVSFSFLLWRGANISGIKCIYFIICYTMKCNATYVCIDMLWNVLLNPFKEGYRQGC